ncbi:hypothetical protein ACC827_38150, partial [Rhizobium ruizarguesonis]
MKLPNLEYFITYRNYYHSVFFEDIAQLSMELVVNTALGEDQMKRVGAGAISNSFQSEVRSCRLFTKRYPL